MASRIFRTEYFALIIGLLVIGVFLLMTFFTAVPERLELKLLSVHFMLKETFRGESVQEGVVYQERNPAISRDIEIVAIDTNSLAQFGRWPWPRWRHADLVNSFARISDQTNRERALFLDLFFIEPSVDAYSDAILVEAIEASERVFVETVLANEPPPPGAADEFFERHEVLFENLGRIDNVQGEWATMRTHFGLEPPLQPYGRAAAGYGHANFDQDWDAVFRHQPLIAKVSRLVEEIRVDELSPTTRVDIENYERLAWADREGTYHHIEQPMTDESIAALRRRMEADAPQALIDTDNDGEIDERFHVVRRFRDQFIPSITLALALDYFNKDYDDLEIVLGEHIVIPDVEVYDTETDEWGPYYVPTRFARTDAEGNIVEEGSYRPVEDIVIPINEDGEMLINYMGPRSSPSRDGHQTFPIRSYAAYTGRGVVGPDPSTWRPTRAADNKILMVGPFSTGMAEDEKLTPYGLMFGVEIHANALNTIVMDRFLRHAPFWMDLTILVGAVLLTAIVAALLRNPLWSFGITIVAILVFFFVTTLVFDSRALIVNFSSPALAMVLTFVAVVVYRVLTEGREKRMITEMFGKYVSPQVVDELIETPPVLGGVEQEITVVFSDIRGFTDMSENMTSQELVKYLNGYLTAMTDVILEYNGTLDKYVGDEIMCFWGAPLPQKDHRILACKCALRQMEALAEFNERMAHLRENDPEWAFLPPKPIDIGIGINSGLMTVGNMGSAGRLNYTLMGDEVNAGARLEGINKQYGTNVIVSENTWGEIRDRAIGRELDLIRVKGKQKPLLIYELVDVEGGIEPTAEELAYDQPEHS
ncbi:MAG: CHASE2 domain-containing protein [Spirochaetota bacterium]